MRSHEELVSHVSKVLSRLAVLFELFLQDIEFLSIGIVGELKCVVYCSGIFSGDVEECGALDFFVFSVNPAGDEE